MLIPYFNCLIVVCLISGTFSQTDIDLFNGTGTTFLTSPNDQSLDVSAEQSNLTDVSIDNTTLTDIDIKDDLVITREPEPHSDITMLITTLDPSEGNATDITQLGSCSYNPCYNGGKCIEDENDAEVFKCLCGYNYTGTRCQISDECVISKDGQLCSNGACVYSNDVLTRFCGCFLGMSWDDAKKKCRKNNPPCFPSPCQNGGECKGIDEETFECLCPTGFEGDTCDVTNFCGKEDTCKNGLCVLDKQQKYCDCQEGYFWNQSTKLCEVRNPPCLPNPCKHHGICLNTSANSFNCSCADGFFGSTCEKEILCPTDENGGYNCGTGGVCEEMEDTKACVCDINFYLDEDSHICREISDPCHPNPCANLGVCLPQSDGLFNCSCSNGFTGNLCKEPDFCELDGGKTFCGEADCMNDAILGSYSCSCDNGKYFDYAAKSCIMLDFCPLMKCDENEVCQDNKCHCKLHYKWNNLTQQCEPYKCPFNPCPSEELICIEGAGISDYECTCPEGSAFNGTHCNKEAACIFPSLNHCGQNCSITGDTHICHCMDDQFQLKDDNKTCQFLGNMTCVNKTCTGGECIAFGEDEVCVCPRGFVEKDGKCLDLCSAGLLFFGFCPDDSCEPIASGFRCKCEGKYKLSSDETTCTVRKMCSELEDGDIACKERNAECIEDWNDPKGYKCQCREGMVEDVTGVCKDRCSIPESQMYCSKFRAFCDSTRNDTLNCKCPPYFKFFQNGTVCNKPALNTYTWTIPLNPDNYKKSRTLKTSRYADGQDIIDEMKVEMDSYTALKSLIPTALGAKIIACKWKTGYFLCKLEIQFSDISDIYLQRVMSPYMCVLNSSYPYVCLVPPALVLQKAYIDILSIEKTNPCDVDIKDDLCGSDTVCQSTSTVASFNCTCGAGFTVRYTEYPFTERNSKIESCKDIDECELNICGENMNCVNTIGSYICSCKDGYRISKDTGSCVELCNPNPCVYGECTKLNEKEFDCKCNAGYNGALCNLLDANFKRARTNTIVVGAVLGGCLLIAIILSYAFISRLKKQKSIDNNEHRLFNTEMTERRSADSGAVNNAYQRE